MSPPRRRSLLLVAFASLAAVAVSGCGDGSGEPGGTDANPASAAFLASTNVPNADDYFTLVGFLTTLEGERAELAGATEHAGFAGVLRSPAAPGAYFVASGEAPTIQRIDVSGGVPSPGLTVSFANLGLTYAPGSTETAFAANGLAYSVSVDQAVVVVWNIDTMTIERTIELAGLGEPGFSPVYPLATVLRDGLLLFPVSYTDWTTGAAPAFTDLIAVNVASGELTRSRDERCSGIRGLATARDGALYGATDGFFAVRRRLYGAAAGTEPCILRVLPGATRFDPDFALASRALADTAIVGDVSISEDGAHVLFNAFDEVASPIAADAEYSDVASAAGWRVHRAPIDAVTDRSGAPGAAIGGLAIGARQGIRFNVAGRTWVVVASADYGSSQLFDVRSSGDVVAGPRFTGSLDTLHAL